MTDSNREQALDAALSQIERAYGKGSVMKMSDQAHSEYKEAVEAYLAIDGVRSAALPDMDGLLDDIHRQFIAQILESHAAGTIDLQVAVQLAVVARFYERLGDHESRSYARLLVEGAGMALRIAFDDWAVRIDGGQDADLLDIYRTTVRDLRRVVAG